MTNVASILREIETEMVSVGDTIRETNWYTQYVVHEITDGENGFFWLLGTPAAQSVRSDARGAGGTGRMFGCRDQED